MRGVTDTETGILLAETRSAICVQRFDDSLSSAIRITYRISLRSSSLQEPRYPLLKVLHWLSFNPSQTAFEGRAKLPRTHAISLVCFPIPCAVTHRHVEVVGFMRFAGHDVVAHTHLLLPRPFPLALSRQSYHTH